jgi:hypothetical protein
VCVISLSRWRVYCYIDQNGVNAVRRWFDENDIPEADRAALDARLDIYEFSGLEAIRSLTVDLGNGFRALLCHRKGGKNPCPVFCEGPLGNDEITFLTGALWNARAKRPEPRYAAAIAELALEVLHSNHKRRRRERFT